MDNDPKVFLVTGATGKQGGAVARHLLIKKYKVRAFTRDPSQKAARQLKEYGAEIVQGNLNDYNSLLKAIEGVYGVFSVQDFWTAGYEDEIIQGKRVADATQEQNVRHLIYSSAGGADKDTGIPHFDSKKAVEKYIIEKGLTYTIFRPVFFMETFLWEDMLTKIRSGTLSMGLQPDTEIQMIAVDDIGHFVASAFENPGKFLGKSIEIAGDELTLLQITEQISKRIGIHVEYNSIPIDELKKVSEEMAIMFSWFNEEGFQAKIDQLREWHPGLKTFNNWLKTVNIDSL